MAGLSSAAENRILVIGIGLTACAILGFMRHMLIIYRDSVELKKPSPKTQYITQGTEDSLRASTLEMLVDSHNYGIQETTARIVCDRALHDGNTLDGVLWELTRPDHYKREKAIRALYLLSEHPAITQLNNPKVFSAIVTCLTYCVKDVPHEKFDKEFDNFDFRDPVESICLQLLFRLTNEFGPQEVIKAGIIPKWLAKEPWGSTPKERVENFRHCYQRMRLSELIHRIANDPYGLSLLVHQAKLISPTDPTFCPRPSKSRYVMLSNVALRVREQSVEERHLRRRHREAMVLNDGVQPIGVSDIIEREYESPVEERRERG